MNKEYDYLIIGGGCAGLSLAYRMSMDPFFDSKLILIVEPQTKSQNDRTWSFWSKDQHFYNKWAIKSWKELAFKGKKKATTLNIAPYKYFTIRGIDFYNNTLPQISSCKNIDQIHSKIISISQNEKVIVAKLENGQSIKTKFCFDSRIPESYNIKNSNFVWQHFKGWIVKAEQDYFDDQKALFMDFSIDQHDDTRFFYILPYSKRKALIQLAIFSNKILSSKSYDGLINNYIHQNHPNLKYKILEEEYDKIPMTDYHFSPTAGKNHMFIGTAAGMVKASSGFAFKRIQDHSDFIIDLLKEGRNPIAATKIIANKKYLHLDGTLLHVILSKSETGQEIFTKLMERNKAKNVFDFLDQKSSLGQEIRIMLSLPFFSFLKSFIRVWMKK